MRKLPFALAILMPTFAVAVAAWAQDPSISRSIVQGLSMATLTTFENGTLVRKRVERSSIPEKFVNLDGQHYYDTIRTANRDVIEACVSRSPVGTSARVHENRDDTCVRNKWLFIDYDQEIRARYQVSRQADGPHLAMTVALRLPRVPQARVNEIWKQSLACVPYVQDVWKRYGVQFDLNLTYVGSKASRHADSEATIHDEQGRSNVENFYYRGLPGEGHYTAVCHKLWTTLTGLGTVHEPESTYCEPFRQQEYCRMITHEIGHYLGLFDEYADRDCPDRPFVSKQKDPWDVMDDAENENWENTEFFPGHVRTIFRPLCSRR